MIRPSFIKEVVLGTKMTIKDWTVELICYNPISCFLRKLGRFVLREIRWIPVLWNQEDWDSEYIYDLLEVKMKELRKDMSKDYWHDQKSVQRGIRQIDICLKRLDMWRNWTNYYEYPMDDVYSEPTEDGKGYVMKYASEENERQRLGANMFEQKNYDKFWKDFLAWHRGWWT